MCMGGGGGAGDIAEENRRQEEERQARITEGTRRVNEIFEGAPIYEWQQSTFRPDELMGEYSNTSRRGGPTKMSYADFQAQQGPFTPSPTGSLGASQSLGGGGGAFANVAQNNYWQQGTPGTWTRGGARLGSDENWGGDVTPTERFTVGTDSPDAQGLAFNPATGQWEGSRRVQTGTTGGYDDAFFGDISKRYTDYYNPQLEDQYTKAREQLQMTLAKQGIMNSSAGQGRFSDLMGEYNRQQQQLTNRGMGEAQKARGDVENLRGDLLSQVESGMGAENAAAIARNRMSAMSQPKQYDPLGDIFQNVTGTLYNARQAEKEGRQGLGGAATKLFTGGTGGGSGRVVS